MTKVESETISKMFERAFNKVLPIPKKGEISKYTIKIGKRFRKDLGDLNSLAASIKEIGLLHPIVVDDENNLIAGYRRLKACEKLGWTNVPVRVVPLKDFVKGEFHENFARKDFITTELVAIKRAIEPEIKEEAKERQLSGKPSKESLEGQKPQERTTQSKVAKFAGVSFDTLRKAEKLVEAAEKQPDKYQSLLDKVDKNQVSVDRAFKEITKAEKWEEQQERNKELVASFQGREDITLIQGDFMEECLKLEDNSVDLILTDPPYGEVFLTKWVELGRIAKRVLKPSGFLVAYYGQYHLIDAFNALNESLDYYWTLALKLTGTRGFMQSRRIINMWKPILVYYKPPLQELAPVEDLIESEAMEKDYHEWQQNLDACRKLVNYFSKPNDLVLDPLMGSGTTVIASYMEKRRAIGIDSDPQAVQSAKARLIQLEQEEQ